MADTVMSALKRAGLKFDDPDLLPLFGDPTAPDFAAAARAKHPLLFHPDAMAASDKEAAAMKAEYLAEANKPKPFTWTTPADFDALSASSAEYEAVKNDYLRAARRR